MTGTDDIGRSLGASEPINPESVWHVVLKDDLKAISHA